MGYDNIAGVESAAASISTNQQALQLLLAVWRSQDHFHFVCTLDKATGKFRNVAVKSPEEAATYASAYSAMGLDAYFAFAEYATAENRKSDNADGSATFVVDLDIGPGKVAAGRGYDTNELAQAALKEFCSKAELPEPTFLVNSGSGIHGYWIFDGFLGREQWLAYSGKLKALMKALGLRADHCRTADIAGVLRVTDTFNYKYNPPKPVTLLSASDQYIDLAMVLDAIDAAMLTLGVVEDVVEPLLELDQFSPAPVITTSGYASEPPNLQQLASALKPLDPDCAEKLWKFYRLGPLAYAAREFPELAEALRDLARRWSSGDLRGIPSKKWVTPSSSNGMSGQQAFNYVWKRFMTDNYTGKRVTIGSIYHHAREVGWIYNKEQRESDDVGQVTP